MTSTKKNGGFIKMKTNRKRIPLKCPICRKDCLTYPRKHVESHFRKQCVGCWFCGKLFTRSAEYFNHSRVYFIKLKKITIKIPSKVVEVHMTSEDTDFVYNTDTIEEEELEEEKEIIKPFSCKVCPKQFTRKHHLKNHYYTHLGLKPYKCLTCHKNFSRNEHLKIHTLMHVGIKPYKCDVCSKQFTQKSNLNKHIRTHDTEKIYKCLTCFKRFSRGDKLKEHIQTYERRDDHKPPNNALTEEEAKPFACDYCIKRYTRKDKLKHHLKSHGIELPTTPRIIKRDPSVIKKPYECDMCQKKFSRKDRLKNHYTSHIKVF